MLNGADTIVALATPPGSAPCCLVRVSGPAADAIARELLVQPPPGDRGIIATRMRLGSSQLPVLALGFTAPRSLTGDDVLELITVSSPLIAQRVLDACSGIAGVRLAQPGEFLARAYLNGKVTLAQAEGTAALIAARAEAEAQAARALASGRTGAAYDQAANQLAGVLALVEAGIDFTDQEDVVAISPDDLVRAIEEVMQSVESLLAQDPSRAARASELRVVLMGEPNAGKSTLFNALLGRARALVSNTPGTTRDVLAEELHLEAVRPGLSRVLLQDSPGIEAARGVIDAAAQEAMQRAHDEGDVVVYCDPTGQFARMPHARRVIRVQTKADTLARKSSDALHVCAMDGRGLTHLREAIADACSQALDDVGLRGASALLPRHREALQGAWGALSDALAIARASHAPPELVAQRARDALNHLGTLSGRMDPDDIIGLVFSRFCVGK